MLLIEKFRMDKPMRPAFIAKLARCPTKRVIRVTIRGSWKWRNSCRRSITIRIDQCQSRTAFLSYYIVSRLAAAQCSLIPPARGEPTKQARKANQSRHQRAQHHLVLALVVLLAHLRHGRREPPRRLRPEPVCLLRLFDVPGPLLRRDVCRVQHRLRLRGVNTYMASTRSSVCRQGSREMSAKASNARQGGCQDLYQSAHPAPN